MIIYSTRHGQTDYNKKDIILGRTDIDLNETGIVQARELADAVAEMNEIDIIVASPMKRAQHTAREVADKTGLEIITDDRLREWDYGEYEAKTRYVEGFAHDKTEFGVRMGRTGESLLQFAHRVYSAIDDIIADYSDKKVLIVSHGGVCRVIETYFHDMSVEKYSTWFMGNCELIKYDTETGGAL